jgi:hypothetical protein
LCDRVLRAGNVDGLTQTLAGHFSQTLHRGAAIAVREYHGSEGAQTVCFLAVRVENDGFVVNLLYEEALVARERSRL